MQALWVIEVSTQISKELFGGQAIVPENAKIKSKWQWGPQELKNATNLAHLPRESVEQE